MYLITIIKKLKYKNKNKNQQRQLVTAPPSSSRLSHGRRVRRRPAAAPAAGPPSRAALCRPASPAARDAGPPHQLTLRAGPGAAATKAGRGRGGFRASVVGGAARCKRSAAMAPRGLLVLLLLALVGPSAALIR